MTATPPDPGSIRPNGIQPDSIRANSIRANSIRAGEITASPPEQTDVGVYFIGRVHTPWATRRDCPRRGDPDHGPLCSIEIEPRWRDALTGIEAHPRIQVLYWMHEARRDLAVQVPASSGKPMGTFALRSPARPNPIASSVVTLIRRTGETLIVRGMDCLDGTPLIDLKPERGAIEGPRTQRDRDPS